MKKYISTIIVLVVVLGGAIYIYANKQAVVAPTEVTSGENKARNLVEEFGTKLKDVSLLAPDATTQIATVYAPYVSQEFISQWQSDPSQAPGRLTSSPWPDHIEINKITKIDSGNGDIWDGNGILVYATSDNARAATRQIYFDVRNSAEGFVITSFSMSDYDIPLTMEYKNDEYGFTFKLPASWQGYTTPKEEWEGYTNVDPSGDKVVTKGPLLLIRHPNWTAKVPRQDIPIMVFTLDQWSDLNAGKFWIGAAPVGPSELGRNAKYVFALPARYNYASETGWEEVQNILNQNPLKAF